MSRKQRMPFCEACNLVPDDTPDGAYWAMAHEIAGLDYGDGFDEIAYDDDEHVCDHCGKVFGSEHSVTQHINAKHSK